ncbi:hypothetical protein, partial [Klebsiella pneumoniae]|uniref:hypothetical protein n=1 Tax=Klebsiella pneumoniae TaxID=573 RepID=UPI001C7215D3
MVNAQEAIYRLFGRLPKTLMNPILVWRGLFTSPQILFFRKIEWTASRLTGFAEQTNKKGRKKSGLLKSYSSWPSASR